MDALKKIWDAVKSHYEKAIAFVVLVSLLGSLVYLAVQVSMIRKKDRNWRREVDTMRPKHAVADLVDEESYAMAFRGIGDPSLIDMAGWTNSMLMVPEARAWCVDCKRPMPMATAMAAGACPFCGKKHVDKKLRDDYDGDGDGIFDSWEKKYGLDPSDPDDSREDRDRDLFTNLEEFNSDPRTDPSDPEDYPPLEAKLYVTNITADPFKLRFKSVLKILPRAVALTPARDVHRLPLNSKIEVAKGTKLVLPDKTEIKYLEAGTINALGGKRFSFTGGETKLGDLDLPTADVVDIPAATVLVVPGRMGKVSREPLPARTQLRCASRQFAMNLYGDRGTYFRLLGENVLGFRLAKYEEKSQTVKVAWSRKPQQIDVSELTLERGKKRIVLVKNKDVMYSEYTVHFLFNLDSSEHVKKMGDVFKLKENEYKLISVDSALKTVIVQRLHDKKDFVIHRIPHALKK
ncbi:Amuc_1099 family pilus-like system protein [Verrucomicrobiota bacterium]